MRPHISINVSDVGKSVEFYSRVFGQDPQKKTVNYAKFDLKEPRLNFTMQSGAERETSRVNHFGIEVGTSEEVKLWEKRLIDAKVLTVPEEGTNCCFAKQDKVWFQDPDGNAWEVFVVLEQIAIVNPDGNLDTPFDKPMNPGKKACC